MNQQEMQLAFALIQDLQSIFDILIISGSIAVREVTKNPNIVPNDVDCIVIGRMDSLRFKIFANKLASNYSNVSFKNYAFYLQNKKILDVTRLDNIKNRAEKEKAKTFVCQMGSMNVHVYNAQHLLKIYEENKRSEDVEKIKSLYLLCPDKVMLITQEQEVSKNVSLKQDVKPRLLSFDEEDENNDLLPDLDGF